MTCWGLSDGGDFNNGKPNLINPTQLSVGYRIACALDDLGVQCWGGGYSQQKSYSNPVYVSAGAYFSCVIDDNGIDCSKTLLVLAQVH